MDGYGIPEVARRTGMTPGEVRLALEEGRLRGAKVAGRWRVPPSELDEAGHDDAVAALHSRLEELERRVEELEGRGPDAPPSMRPALEPLFGRRPDPPR